MKHIGIIIFLTLALTSVSALSGCATTPQVAATYPQVPSASVIYHTVSEGETLWRIAKTYNIEIGKIAEANKLQDPSKITTGQMLLIPSARKQLIVPEEIATDIGKVGFIWPVKGRISSYFGQKRYNAVNRGIDITAEKGSSVIASRDGVVAFTDDKVKGFGKTIIIGHGDGYSTVYAHNSEILVKPGDDVKRNQVIARVGKSSRSDKYTLHFEIRKRQIPKDPFYYLP
jgi:murein DD-endopeptidase MepM/ murein hydrolase activator NlpD